MSINILIKNRLNFSFGLKYNAIVLLKKIGVNTFMKNSRKNNFTNLKIRQNNHLLANLSCFEDIL